jgi:hypothetical protein
MGIYKDFIWDFHLDLLELNRITYIYICVGILFGFIVI